MLVDVEFMLVELLERAKGFFAEPTEENAGRTMDEAKVNRMFGHEVAATGVYYVGTPNTANHLREIVDLGKRGRDDWCNGRAYGNAASFNEILDYARPDALDQPCVVFIDRLPEVPPKSGPWIGPRKADGTPVDASVVLHWWLVPIDPAKLEAALEKRSALSPSP